MTDSGAGTPDRASLDAAGPEAVRPRVSKHRSFWWLMTAAGAGAAAATVVGFFGGLW